MRNIKIIITLAVASIVISFLFANYYINFEHKNLKTLGAIGLAISVVRLALNIAIGWFLFEQALIEYKFFQNKIRNVLLVFFAVFAAVFPVYDILWEFYGLEVGSEGICQNFALSPVLKIFCEWEIDNWLGFLFNLFIFFFIIFIIKRFNK